ncbi:MAG: PGF-CTERM sorting domain-containing protein [Halobacteria archaeon]|nr:PGF-CTERM sorting domain-containing protein [Halobacteria archaeon]
MRRETALGLGVLAVVLFVLGVTILVPGAVEKPQDPVRRSYIHVNEVSLKPVSVTGSNVTLRVETRFDHSEGVSENTTVTVRATSTETGLLETTRTKDVGDVKDEREVSVTHNVTVERSGGYRVDSVVYTDGRRVSSASKSVEGVGSLKPEYARSPLGFESFGSQPSIEYSVDEVDRSTVALNVTAYVTNTGGRQTGNTYVVLKARQSESGIVADERRVDVGEIDEGETDRVNGRLVVPDGYNYYLDAVLWKDDVVLGTTRSGASLNPSKSIPTNVTQEEVGIRVEDFERDDEPQSRSDELESEVPEDGQGQPGLGVVAAVLAVSAVGVRRWYYD